MSAIPLSGEEPIPSISGAITRSRLQDKWGHASRRRLTIIAAPPGYGKTTLAAQFAYGADCPIAWHPVEERERDLPIFYQQSILALAQAVPGIDRLIDKTNSTPDALAIQVTDYLRDHLARPMLYVIDDIHHLVGSQTAETWLQTFIKFLPRHCQLLLVGRMMPKLPLTEMIARNELVAIGQNELAFTEEEVRQVAQQNAQPNFDSGLVAHLEGWPAGVSLALRPLPAEVGALLTDGGQGPEAIFDTLAGVLVRSLPVHLQDFLLASSALRRITPELCIKVLGLEGSDTLEEIYRRQLFVSRISQGFVYHGLLRSFLQRSLKAEDPQQFRRLHEQAAAWFAENHLWDEAFDHFCEAGCVDQAAALAERVAQAYYTRGQVESLLRWGEQLGAHAQAAPRLLYVNAGIQIHRFQFDRAEVLLAEAFQGFQKRQDEVGLVDVRLRRATLHRLSGQYEEAANEAEQIVWQLADSPQVDGKRGVALNILGTALLFLGDMKRGMQYLEEALPLYRSHSEADAIAALLQNLEFAYNQMGRFDEASRCLHEVVALQRSLGKTDRLAMALNNLGYYYHQRGYYPQAQETLEEGLEIVQQVFGRRSESYLRWSMGDFQRDVGCFEEALQHYNRALELAEDHEPVVSCAVFNSLAVLYRWQGSLEQSVSMAHKAQALAERHKIAIERVKAQAADYLAAVLSGDSMGGAQKMNALITHMDKNQGQIEWMQILTQGSLAALLSQDLASAHRYFDEACRDAQASGIFQPLVIEVLQAPLLRQFVRRFPSKWAVLTAWLGQLEQAQLKPEPVQKAVPFKLRSTYSLRVYSLGQEQIERDGESLTLSEWVTATSRHLFFYLLFYGPAAREQISLVFWPDQSPQQIRSNFHTQLYRVRLKLGEEVIQFENDLYQINPELTIWCDVYEFESLVQQARLGSPESIYTNELWQAAIDLYQGEFLPSVDADWVVARRQDLQEQYIEALLGRGDCARRRRDFGAALAVLNRALEVDIYREDVHRLVIQCYSEMGEKGQAMRHFHKLRTLLQNELATSPSAVTLALANSLI